MTTKKIQKLAEKTYLSENLNKGVLNKISTSLGRKKLKEYIKELKNIEKRKLVKIYVPSKKVLTNELENSLKKFFQNKKLSIIEDPSILAGIKIIDNDMVYELNLRDSLTHIIEHIQKSYD